MRIDGSAYVVDLSRPDSASKEVGAAATDRKGDGGNSVDRVDISSGGRSIGDLKRDLDALPDVRLDRVALARQTLQDGGYQVQPALLAQKMIEAFGAH